MKRTLFYVLIAVLIGLVTFWWSDGGTTSKHPGTIELQTRKQLAAYIDKKVKRRENGYFKQDKPDKYLEYLSFLKSPLNGDFSYRHNQNLMELKSAREHRAVLKASRSVLDWKERGPGNVGGRTRGFIVDPDDPQANTWLAGSVGGGIWKTMDAGENWECITSDWPNLSISTLAMAESNHSVIYAGTGEGFGNVDAILGNGIFKSTDKGQSWQLLESTENSKHFSYTNKIVVHPQDEDQVYAVTNTGIFQSIDGGANWYNVYNYTSEGYYQRVQDLRMNPANSLELTASVNNVGIVRSEDGGNNWKLIYTIQEGRIELCYSTKNPGYIYALSEESNLYLSIDGGDNWKQLAVSGTKVDFLSGQGWYNNTLIADPYNDKTILVGGIDIHEITIGNVKPGTESSVYNIVNEVGHLFTFGDIDGQYLMGGLKVEDLAYSALVDVEIRFGSSKSQKAHFFTVGSSDEPSVNSEKYIYSGYMDVPFEVWDTKNGNQLMISIRDQNENGQFDLTELSLEQIHVHNIVYNESVASEEIAKNGGVASLRVFTLYPKMQKNITWQPNEIADCRIILNKYTLSQYEMESARKTDWRYPGASYYSHADHHNLIITNKAGTPYRLINCNDGGVFMSDDGGKNWLEKTRGYVTSQFYGVSKHPYYNIYIGGTQDNGTWMSGEDSDALSEWKNALGGDGFETVWHSVDPAKFATSLYYNEIYISFDGSKLNKVSGIGDNSDSSAPFITRISNCYSNPELLLVGGKSGIWRSSDFGVSWKLIQMPEGTWDYGDYNPQMEISPADGNIVWAGCVASDKLRPAISTDGGLTFTSVSSPVQASDRILSVSNIVAHPTEPHTAFILFAVGGYPKIFKTEDLGQTWTELSGFGANAKSINGFPDVAVYDLMVMPHNTKIIWAGTEIGLFESKDGGQSWLYADNGLPAVCIWDMKIVDQQVVVGTHGRGVWTLDINELLVPIKPPYIQYASKRPDSKFGYKVIYPQNFDSVKVYFDDIIWDNQDNVTVGEMIASPFDYELDNSSFEIKLVGYVNSEEFVSNIKKVENPTFENVVEKYTNSFSSRKTDFSGSYFTVNNTLFNDYAIHTPHPYVEETTYTYVLKYPILIMDEMEKAVLNYNDIVLVEPGEAGTKFGDEEYWDYVVVEGTTDGVNWKPLADGYDVNYSTKWIDFVKDNDINTKPDSRDLYVNHTINLHDTFSPGDIVQIRFRLYSDPASVGWGWVIDDLIIQEDGTGIIETKGPDGMIKVSPNPARDYIYLELDTKDRGDILVDIYNVGGKRQLEQRFVKESDKWMQSIELSGIDYGVKLVVVRINGKMYSNKFIKK